MLKWRKDFIKNPPKDNSLVLVIFRYNNAPVLDRMKNPGIYIPETEIGLAVFVDGVYKIKGHLFTVTLGEEEKIIQIAEVTIPEDFEFKGNL